MSEGLEAGHSDRNGLEFPAKLHGFGGIVDGFIIPVRGSGRGTLNQMQLVAVVIELLVIADLGPE